MLILCFSVMSINVSTGHAQDVRWLRIGELQTPINEVGAEYEEEFDAPGATSNFLSWPAQYSIHQTTCRMKGVWLACRNFDFPPAHHPTISCYKIRGKALKMLQKSFFKDYTT